MKKRALVLSGGGSKGAYQCGAINYLLGVEKKHYEIILGTSVGAQNGAGLAMFKEGEESKAVQFLNETWSLVTTEKILKPWLPGRLWDFLGYVWAFIQGKPTVYDSSPMTKFLSERFDLNLARKSGKKLFVGAVSIDTGDHKLFDLDHPSIFEAIIASSAMPTILAPEFIECQTWVDGGVKNVACISAAIDQGVDEIDVIITDPEKIEFKDMDNSNFVNIALRSLEIAVNEIITNDVRGALLYNELLEYKRIPGKRHVDIRIIRPVKPLLGDSYKFEQENIQNNIRVGFEDAKKLLSR